MDTPIQKARELYHQKLTLGKHVSSEHSANKAVDDDIHRFISIAVKSARQASTLFRHTCIIDSLINTLNTCVTNDLDVKLVAGAYRCLEKYFWLVVQQPWKPEYQMLKTYGGFYTTKIKSILNMAEMIFNSAGYVLDRDNQLVLMRINVNKDQLLALSFDCFVASELSESIADHYAKLRTVGKTLNDAIFEILKDSWSKNIISPPDVPKREPFSNDSETRRNGMKVLYPTGPSPVYDENINGRNPEESLGNFKYKRNLDPRIPIMDEDEHYPRLSQATPEEHIRESMKHMQIPQKPPLINPWANKIEDFVGSSSVDPRVVTFPPAYHNGSNGRYSGLSFLKDEGIGGDISSVSKLGLNSNSPYNTSFTNKSESSDLGYGTGMVYPSPLMTTSQDLQSDTIYRPPSINNERDSTIITRGPMQPPPIPSRDLKPGRGVDVVDGAPIFTDAVFNQSGKGEGTTIMTSSSLLPPEAALNAIRGIRPSRPLHQLKSNSLKVPAKKVISNDRISKSMDYSSGQRRCSVCDSTFSNAETTCVRCSQLEPKKSCKSCTFDNDMQRTECEVCGQSLSADLTYDSWR